MIWKVIGTICSLSFFVTGFSVLGDPNCVTAEIGGGRVIGVTCRPDTYGTWSGGAAASIMLSLGTALLVFAFWREIRNIITPNVQTPSQSVRMTSPTPGMNTAKSNVHSVSNVKSGKKMYKQCSKCNTMMRYEWGHCSKCLSTKLVDISEEKMLGMSDSISLKPSKKQVRPSLSISSEEAMWEVFNESKVEAGNVSNPEFKTCPMCAEDIKFAAKKCRYCQYMIEA